MAADLNNLFDFCDVLGVNEENGTILLQTGSVFEEDPRSEGDEMWLPSGIISKPALPNANLDAAQAVSIVRGDQNVCIGFRDVRANSLIETIGYGEVFLFAGGPNNTGTSKMYLSNDGTNQKITITAGTTKIEINSSGVVNITADMVNLSGASDFAALAAKVDANFSALTAAISAGTAAGSPFTWVAPSNPSVAASNVKIS